MSVKEVAVLEGWYFSSQSELLLSKSFDWLEKRPTLQSKKRPTLQSFMDK